MQHVKEYVKKHYPRTFKDREPIVEDHRSHYRVYWNRDASPLILSKI